MKLKKDFEAIRRGSVTLLPTPETVLPNKLGESRGDETTGETHHVTIGST
jgi:hypothetical protein